MNRDVTGLLSSRILRFVFVITALVAAINARAAFPENIKGIDPDKVGILIYDLNGDSVVMDHNGSKWLIPASVMKSVTSAAVLLTEDADGKFSTQVVTDGKIKGGSLEGNLIVECNGDPTVESRHFQNNIGICDSIVASLKRLGIKSIGGSVVINQDNFQDAGIPASWLNEDILWPYGTGLYGANYKDNTIKLSLPSGVMTPSVPSVTVEREPSNGGLKISRQRGSKQFIVRGKVKGSHSDNYANPDPASTMQTEILNAIRAAGISVGNEAVKDGGKREVIYTHTSPVIRDILHSLMVRSDNMMAEGMLRSIAPGKKRADAIKRETVLWKEAKIPMEQLVIEDGSGLSRNDRLSALFLTGLYRYMLTTDAAADYVSLFPRAGLEGTMRNFLKSTALEGRIAMKTGSMRGVQCFGGYLLDEQGKPTHTIVVLVNGFTADRARVKSSIANLLLEKFVPTKNLDN